MSTVMSVVMPAHDEETIIARSLHSLVASDAKGRLEIVVVANGCHDQTAAVAAAVSSRIRVVQIATPSKIAALNAGDDVATAFPRAYVDADVDVNADALLAVASRLDDEAGVLVGAPLLRVDTARASLAVRQYYRVWEQSEYRVPGHVGSGVYVLSKGGRARFGRFPDVIADDRFVQRLFTADERVTVGEASFTVPAPRTFGALLRRATRIASGNRQLAAEHPASADGNGSPRFSALIKRVAKRPSLWFAFGTYCCGYIVPRIQARLLEAAGRTPGWNRDDTTRVSA
jgi:glycosyltransferase involved in cell wall biosynthesis